MLDGVGVYDTIKALLEECISHEISAKLLHRWVPVKIWFHACLKIAPQSQLRPSLGESGLEEKNFNSCLSRHAVYRQTVESFDLIINSTGIFKIKIGKKYFLFITQQKGQFSPQQPVIGKQFYEAVKETEKQFLRSLRRFDFEFMNPPDAQRRRLAVEPAEEEGKEEEVVVVETNDNNQEEEDEEEILVDPFWSSLDARKLFGARPTDPDASVTLRRKINTLKIINHQKKEGYKLIIDGGDALNECTAADISRLKERSLILLLAYKTCLRRMGNDGHASFSSCIQEVLQIFEDTGINQATHWETVRIWNRSFRRRELWPHPRGP
jgi:hypothetical protein